MVGCFCGGCAERTKLGKQKQNKKKKVCKKHENTSSTQLREHVRVDGVNRWMVCSFCGSGVEKKKKKKKDKKRRRKEKKKQNKTKTKEKRKEKRRKKEEQKNVQKPRGHLLNPAERACESTA